jgi:hypothetical protein
MAQATKVATPLDKARAARKANAQPRDESGEARFKRLANARLGPTVKSILRLGNLARTQPGPDAPKGADGKAAVHKPTPEQIAAIMRTLEKAVNTVGAQLTGSKTSADVPRF